MKDPSRKTKTVTRPPNATMLTKPQSAEQKQKFIWENSLFDEISDQSRDGSSLVSQDQNADSQRILVKKSTSPKDNKDTLEIMHKAHPADSELTQDVPMLDRNQSQRTSASQPGAVHVPGLARRSPSSPIDTNGANEGAPIFQADLVSEQQEEIQDVEAPTSSASVPHLPVVAEAMKDGMMKTSVSFTSLDRRLMTILSILFIIIVGFAVGITIVLVKKDDTKAASTEISPANLNPTGSPLAFTSPPTPLNEQYFVFLPPSPAECLQIMNGKVVLDQDLMILKTYHIEMDIVLDPAVLDVTSYLNTLVTHMQAKVAPVLAQCESFNRRRLRGMSFRDSGSSQSRRNLATDYLVANAQFSNARLETNRPCKIGVPEPCFKVTETIHVYIKQEELDMELIGLIMDALDVASLVQLLDLNFPFKSIEMIGVASNVEVASPQNIFASISEDSVEEEDSEER